jgi:hypothetical protein
VLFIVSGLDKETLNSGEVAIDLNLPEVDHATRIYAPFAEDAPSADDKFNWAAFCVRKDGKKLTFVSVNKLMA